MNKADFISDVVLGGMKNDLIRMRGCIRPDSSEVGNMYFPLALCVLSYMECLGGFLFGEDNRFAINVEEYIKVCFKNPTEYPVEILKDLIRNGLAHEYFPRGAISRNGKHPAIYKGRTFSLVLDVETLVNDFIESLDDFINKLEDDRYEARMQEALKKTETFEEEHKELIGHLEGQPGDDDQATPSKGPSGYTGPISTTTTDPSINSK